MNNYINLVENILLIENNFLLLLQKFSNLISIIFEYGNKNEK